MTDALNANVVLNKLARALPKQLHEHLIVVGSLSAAAQLLKDTNAELRTKDIDGMLAPNATAVIAAQKIATELISAGWEPRHDERFTFPADASTPEDQLPVIRLRPPGTGRDEWFLELLGAPPAIAPDAQGRTRYSDRVQTATSHFEIPSFAYLGVTQYQTVQHESGLMMASVAMMALSNLLHHPQIGEATMKAPILGREIKRANKDLGRVIAMASIVDVMDENALEGWPEIWRQALSALGAPVSTVERLVSINSGVNALLVSHADQNEALHSVNNGLLSSRPMDLRQFKIAIERYLQRTKAR
jgi:hypothetical protein